MAENSSFHKDKYSFFVEKVSLEKSLDLVLRLFLNRLVFLRKVVVLFCDSIFVPEPGNEDISLSLILGPLGVFASFSLEEWYS